MMLLPSKAGIFLSLLSLTGVVAGLSQAGPGVLGVYGPVPGLPPSPYYRLQVREEGAQAWLETFTLLTECTGEKFCNTTGVFRHLANWSNSYLNFEMSEDVRVEVKITKLYGDPVTKAKVRPETAASCEVREGEVFLSLDRPALFTVDINGQMEDQDTGWKPTGDHTGGFYDGPPIHTLTIFANPTLSKPSLSDPGVHQVSPGQEAPTEGPWHTLYFLPGLHDIGTAFRLHANRSYYIPGEAVVYGTMNNNKTYSDGHDILIFGHGTLSGDKLPHPDYAGPDVDDDDYGTVNIAGNSPHRSSEPVPAVSIQGRSTPGWRESLWLTRPCTP